MRDRTIDIAKGIGILLVVLGHIQTDLYSRTAVLIAGCHMPIFFFFSGLFFEKTFAKYQGARFIQNKTRTLFIPFLIWSFIALIVNAVLLVIHNQTAKIGEEAFEIFICARSVWFLIVLFYTMLLCWLIMKTVQLRKWAFVTASLGIWFFCILVVGSIPYFAFYKFEWIFPYFLLGFFAACGNRYSGFIKSFSFKGKRKQLLITVAFVMIYTTLGLTTYSRDLFDEFYVSFQLNSSHMGQYILYYFIGGVGVFTVILFAAYLSSFERIAEKLADWGKNSLDIYVIHMFAVKLIMILGEQSTMIKHLLQNQAVLICLSFIITAGIVEVVTRILNKNRLYRFCTGKL